MFGSNKQFSVFYFHNCVNEILPKQLIYPLWRATDMNGLSYRLKRR